MDATTTLTAAANRFFRNLGVNDTQGIEHFQQRVFVLELLEIGELREFVDVHF